GALPDAPAIMSSAAAVAAVAWVTVLHFRGRRNTIVACGAAVTAFVAFGKVLSPQYVAWLVPLVPAAGLAASAVLVAALALTHSEWDRFASGHGSVEHWGQVLSWWILARDLVLVALFALLVPRLRVGARSRTRR